MIALLALCASLGVCEPALEDSFQHLHDNPKAIVISHSAYRGMGTNTEQWRTLVQQYWPSDKVDRVLCLMGHESGGNKNAVSPTNDHGLMQINHYYWGDVFGVTKNDLYDPDLNVRLAYQIYLRQGWTAWAVYNKGKCH